MGRHSGAKRRLGRRRTIPEGPCPREKVPATSNEFPPPVFESPLTEDPLANMALIAAGAGNPLETIADAGHILGTSQAAPGECRRNCETEYETTTVPFSPGAVTVKD